MDAGSRDLLDLPERPGKLALERALIVEPLHEVGRPQRRAIKDLEAYPSTLRQTAGCQAEPSLVDDTGWDQDPGPSISDPVGDFATL